MDKKILIAEDEPEASKLLKLRLESNGYNVITAGDGCEALKKAEGERPDLILLDVKMPNMDGYTALKALKDDEKTKKIPVIMLTAYDQMEDLFEVEHIDDFIVKPCDSRDLLLRISRVLKKTVS